jgi:hypothetical protein
MAHSKILVKYRRIGVLEEPHTGLMPTMTSMQILFAMMVKETISSITDSETELSSTTLRYSPTGATTKVRPYSGQISMEMVGLIPCVTILMECTLGILTSGLESSFH